MKRVTVLLAAGLILLAAVGLPTIRASAQSTDVTDDNLQQMIESAKTPAQHEAIAAYYKKEAAAARKKAELHENAAQTYEKLGISKPVGMAQMCKDIASYWKKVAKEDSELAKAHMAMAKAAEASH